MAKTTAMRTVAAVKGRPAQYTQSSRKGKQSWRKNIDLSATEAALEDIREQERVVGAPVHTHKDSQLFVEDRSGQETQLARQAREKRKLRSQEILEQRSAVPAVQQRMQATFKLDTKTPGGKASTAGLPAKLKRRLRILAQRPHEGIEGDSERGSAGKLQSDSVFTEKHNLWSDPAPEKQAGQDDWITPVVKTAILRPSSPLHEPSRIAKKAAAVPVPHAGASYNPDYKEHEQLLQEAYEKAKAEEDADAEKEYLKRKFSELRPYRNDATTGMVIGEFGEEADENQKGEEEYSAPKMPGRKTQAQRRREARAKEQKRVAEQRKKMRIQRGMVSEMPARAKKLKALTSERQALADERRQRKLTRMQEKGIAGLRVSKYSVPESRVDVQTGDELSENFRKLKPEGNLFWDRFQSMQARGLVEARRPVQPSRRKRKTKSYDRHSFKRD
ncbi:hypothetical protein MVES1_000029 [Malassezia vespertilionis]|nr:uncharacterized protein MVES1_000029 [Malassezia vespertilionis]WFD04705.1 hypothetical protein MVES1_000029 [Malassezia vespertilionis]